MASKKKKQRDNKNLFVFVLLVCLPVIAFYFLQKSSSPLIPTPGRPPASEGINTNPVTIRFLEVESLWEEKDFVYDTQKIYLVPDIADIGAFRDNYEIGSKNQFVAVEIDVRDRRTTGNRRRVPFNEYFRLRIDGVDSIPVGEEYKFLSPQEDARIFVKFVIDKQTTSFALLSGPLARPRLTTVDFEGEGVEVIQGVFLREEGFASEYPVD